MKIPNHGGRKKKDSRNPESRADTRDAPVAPGPAIYDGDL